MEVLSFGRFISCETTALAVIVANLRQRRRVVGTVLDRAAS